MTEAQEQLRSASGARITVVSPDAAAVFLDHIGERSLDDVWVGFGARQESGPLIGVAVLGASTADDGRALVAVAPAWRRLHIGLDLLDALTAEASRRGVRQLRASYPADAHVADAFVRATGLRVVTRTVNGLVSAVLFVP
ncbi:MAG: hypothetical protein AB7H43_02765 [Acidimicrobiia bacterium]